ncbi:MAG: Hsp20/alpha crystallin family protein [Planctomycetes bacterium]|nr:Hsp20/alpha crystallin family protein [Planctomycetota bacterium]
MTGKTRKETKRKACRRPYVDVFETDRNVVLQFELPGIASDEIEVGVEGDSLRVETTAMIDGGGRGEVLLREFVPANFYREFVLSRDLDRENIHASWSNGVLTLKVPKAAEAQPHKIEIRTPE